MRVMRSAEASVRHVVLKMNLLRIGANDFLKFPKIIVCIANREIPLRNSSGVLTVTPNGDLVLLNSSGIAIGNWQPCMKFGWSTDTNRYLTSWKDVSDPSPGDVTFRLENIGMPQFVLLKGSETIYRSGPWNGIEFSGSC
ncbi:S-locus-specific glycoprotein S6-like [Olea europaea var. sylvestris]|uniref:S-locus-specific glycoprotein S6-like n=1 Tax=Olea europaea var. sylvestris TaxID=158386 RepID=UPI000C1D4ACC|nr:S-locus-specific glycoprotein S6-like [Olea europaea var. sylvestris]